MLSRAAEPEASRYYAERLWRSEDLWTDFAVRVAEHPDKVAFACDDWSLTYAELERASIALSARLAAGPVQRGDVVALFGRNSLQAAVSIVACLHLGAVLAPVPPMFSVAQLRALVEQCDAKALIAFGGEREIARCAELAEHVPLVLAFHDEVLESLLADRVADGSREPVHADDVALLLHSSGTTSVPKGVVHSSNTVRYTAEQIHERWELSGDDVHLVVCEFGFVGSIIFGYAPVLVSGATGVLLAQWTAADALALIERHACGYTLLMPTHSADLLTQGELDRHDLSSLRALAAPGLSRERRAEMRRRFTVPPLADYGLSEVPGHAAHGLAEAEEKMLSTEGRPYRGTQIAILGDDGEPVAPGMEGEIVVNGPSRFLGFLGNDELTRASLTPARQYRTGDIGVLDEDGHLIYHGRSKDIIRRGGVTIVPAEVEPAILRHPAVHEVALVGLPDDRLGERACAAVILTPGSEGLSLEQLTDFLDAEGVAKYTWPERIELFDDFPRTSSLKPVKRDIVAAIAARTAATGAVRPAASPTPAP
jgi:acyl-coenzyme A synthetase/AMP-(fatty) acid ligase